MSSNSFGRLFSFTTFGESHGPALGVVIDGFPSNIKIDKELLKSFLQRRRPGQNKFTTSRNEDDSYSILSGVFEGRSTGAPIAVVVYNTDQRSKDYSDIKDLFRPGHADYTYEMKYHNRDYRGGGRSSGRETLSRVIAGAFASMALREYGIKVKALLSQVGSIKIKNIDFDSPILPPLYAPLSPEKELMEKEVEKIREEKDSIGSVVSCIISNLPVGLGEPSFDKLDALLAHAMFSIGAVKGFEIGSGFSSSEKRGSQNNDSIYLDNGKVSFRTNNSGGILGGISNGDDVIFSVYFKPTPSIGLSQQTINKEMKEQTISIKGRHDPIIGPRAVVVVEAMASAVILDSLLIYKSYNDGKF